MERHIVNPEQKMDTNGFTERLLAYGGKPLAGICPAADAPGSGDAHV